MSAGVNRRRLLVMADQGASSLSNTVVGVFAARALSAEGFGAFGLAWVAYFMALGACRAVVGEPLLSLYSHEDRARRALRVPELLGATLTISAISALLVAGFGLALEGPPSSALLAFAVVTPFVLLQDTWRFVYIIDRAGLALALDMVWLIAVCVALPLAPADAGAGWFVVAWGVSAAPALVVAAWADRRVLMRRWPLVRWLRLERATNSRFLGEYVSTQASQQVTLAAVGGIAGITALGAIRAVQILYGPLNTIHRGIYLAVVPDGARVKGDPPRLRRLAVRASALVVAVAAGWLAVTVAMPDSLGESLFGASWAEGRDLVIPMGLAMIAGSAATGGFAGVRALGDPRASLRARLISLPGELVLPLVGAWWAGAAGFIFGFGAARVVSSIVWWRVFLEEGPAAAATEAQGRPESNGSAAAGAPAAPEALALVAPLDGD